MHCHLGCSVDLSKVLVVQQRRAAYIFSPDFVPGLIIVQVVLLI